MNHERITLEDTPMSILQKLSEGNPGAVTALCELMKESPEVDPESALGSLAPALSLDTHAIYGTDGPVDVAKGLSMFEKASTAGNSYAQASLGWLYREGYGGTRQDYNEAVKWYQQSAHETPP